MFRTVYRFVGTDEYELVKSASYATQTTEKAQHLYQYLCNQLEEISQRDDFGELIHSHTMTSEGGGRIGGGQVFASFTSDVQKLRQSTDDAVQLIIGGAEYLLTFTVPRDGAIDAASDLSKAEGEVLVPNDLEALGACLTDYCKNPYRQ